MIGINITSNFYINVGKKKRKKRIDIIDNKYSPSLT